MIFAPKMSEIVVEFDSFAMEPDLTPPPGAICRYDWLEIWDGFPAGEGGFGMFFPAKILKDLRILHSSPQL